MTAPDAGWYPDPADALRVRWWSGAAWTEHVRPHPERVVPVPPSPPATLAQSATPAQPAYKVPATPITRPGAASAAAARPLGRADRERQMRRNNPFAYTGLLLALIAFLINPFAIPSLLGTVFSAIGIARAAGIDPAVRYNGRVTSIIGLILGLAGLALVGWRLTQVLG